MKRGKNRRDICNQAIDCQLAQDHCRILCGRKGERCGYIGNVKATAVINIGQGIEIQCTFQGASHDLI